MISWLHTYQSTIIRNILFQCLHDVMYHIHMNLKQNKIKTTTSSASIWQAGIGLCMTGWYWIVYDRLVLDRVWQAGIGLCTTGWYWIVYDRLVLDRVWQAGIGSWLKNLLGKYFNTYKFIILRILNFKGNTCRSNKFTWLTWKQLIPHISNNAPWWYSTVFHCTHVSHIICFSYCTRSQLSKYFIVLQLQSTSHLLVC